MAMEMGFFSIPTRDLDLAKNFYNNIMGWDFQDKDENSVYIYANDNIIGSLEKSHESFSPSAFGPKMFFKADSMKEVMTKVEAVKGQVLQPHTQVSGSDKGYTSEILDTSGNRIAFWTPNP